MTDHKIRAVYVGGPWDGRTEIVDTLTRRAVAPQIDGEIPLAPESLEEALEGVTLREVEYRAVDGRDLDRTMVRTFLADGVDRPPTLWESLLESERLARRAASLERELAEVRAQRDRLATQVGDLADALEEARLAAASSGNR
jgi:hypothetical protein